MYYIIINIFLLFGSLRHNRWLNPSVKQRRNPCSGPPPVYQDLSMRRDWPVKKAFVALPIRMKENSKPISGNSLSLLGTWDKDIGAASQTLLTEWLLCGSLFHLVHLVIMAGKPGCEHT